MLNILISVGAGLAIISVIIAALWINGIVRVNFVWFLCSILFLFLYVISLVYGHMVVPVDFVLDDPKWNWGGKILATLMWIIVLTALFRLKSGFKLSDAGFTFSQRTGSLRPALVVSAIFIALQIFVTYMRGGNTYDTEELWFQALMPGIDEEPVYRGVLLYLMSLAIASKSVDIVGARIDAAGALLCVLFGLGHGLSYNGVIWNFSWTDVLLIGGYGFLLLWLRERTGSLVVPILIHNAINVVGQFVPPN